MSRIINDLLEPMVKKYCQYYFDHMPSPNMKVIKKEWRNGVYGIYNSKTKSIELNPQYIEDLTKIPELKDTVLHELVHAWVDWKGLSSSFADGHNEYFIWKALELDLDIHYLVVSARFRKYLRSRIKSSNSWSIFSIVLLFGGTVILWSNKKARHIK